MSNNEQMSLVAIHNDEQTDDQLQAEFLQFVVSGNYTAKEIEEAYYVLLGINKNEDTTPINEVLFEKMHEMETAHFPVNWLSYIESTRLTPNEKRVLQSNIGSDVREFLVYLKKNANEYAKITIPKNPDTTISENEFVL